MSMMMMMMMMLGMGKGMLMIMCTRRGGRGMTFGQLQCKFTN